MSDKRIRKRYNKTLGTSVKRPLSPQQSKTLEGETIHISVVPSLSLIMLSSKVTLSIGYVGLSVKHKCHVIDRRGILDFK